MYIGVWQEYELAKMLSSRRRPESSTAGKEVLTGRIPSTHQSVSKRCYGESAALTAREHAMKPIVSKPSKPSSKLARIAAMRHLYLRQPSSEAPPDLLVDSRQPISDDDLINWGLNLDSENMPMFTNIL